jgi:hypothetical protein
MKRMDTELLLKRAVNDELPKGHHVMQNVGSVIERAVTGGKRAPELTVPLDKLTGCYLAGEPHADAIVIAKAVHRFSVCVGVAGEAAARALLRPWADMDALALSAALAARPNLRR